MDTLVDLQPDFLCTDVSVAMDETLYGTAVNVTTWLVLEYRAPWHAEAPADNELPESIQAWLTTQLAALENGRLQFIRRKNEVGTPLNFYIGISKENDQRLYHFELESYGALLDLDVAAVVAGNDAYARYQTNDPLVLVCTHGKRDRCCPLLGLPILKALRAALGDAVWQTTHTGGHRFAPTLIVLPEGGCYGRLTTVDVPALIDAVRNKSLLLEKLRGQTYFTAVEQFADYVLRHETNQMNRAHYQHLSTTAVSGSRWQIAFSEPSAEQIHTLTIEKEADPLRLYGRSGSFQVKEVPQFTFIAHDITIAP